MLAGLIARLITMTYLKFLGPGNYLGIHFGLWGLAVNFIVFTIASMLSRGDPGFDEFSKGLKEKEESA